MSNLLFGKDKKVYVEKVIGDPNKPVFTAIVEANDSDLPNNRVSGDTLTIGPGFKKLSMETMTLVHAYFAEIYERYHSEAIVLFHKTSEDEDYTVLVPESFSATAASLTYEHSQPMFCTTCKICSINEDITTCPRCGTETMKRTSILGTAHSHGSMSAFHSGTDDEHEKGQTGFHITFGNVDKGMYSVCPSFVVALNGYTKDGKGIRHLPKLEELVEVPDPLSVTARHTINAWTTTLFNSEVLGSLPENAIVIVENGKEVPVYRGYSKDAVTRWLESQGTRQALLVTLTSSQVKEELKKLRKSSSSGQNTTNRNRNRHRSASAEVTTKPTKDTMQPQDYPTNQTATSNTTTHGKKTMTSSCEETTQAGQCLGSGIDTVDTLFTYDLSVYKVDVDSELEITLLNLGGIEPTPWKAYDELHNSWNDGVFGVWTTIYILGQLAELIEEVIPKQTYGIETYIDDAFKDVEKTVRNLFGDSSVAAENAVSEYSLGYGANQVDAVTSVKNSVNCVRRLLEDNSCTESAEDEDVLKMLASLLVLTKFMMICIDEAEDRELLDDESYQELGEALQSTVTAVLRQANAILIAREPANAS